MRTLLLVAVLSSTTLVDADDRLKRQFFENRIRPVLIEHCYECHSADGDELSGGLLLDSKAWQKGGDSGPTIVVGQPNDSLLVEAISYRNPDLQMPPEGRLPQNIVEDFRRWIRDGAFDPREAKIRSDVEEFDVYRRASEHWAWQSPQPSQRLDSIDQFIDDQLQSRSLVRSPPASPRQLLRRLYFDLIGLPPSPEEIEHFAIGWNDNSEAALSEVVDQLLQSPRFGEKWASHWFDVVDFSETKGHVTDQERPFSWKYRDYVIDAFNDDLPYDRFVTEHIAGDLLPESLHRKGKRGESNIAPTATGALFMHEMHFMAVDPVKQRWDEIDAQIDVLGKAFLGLTTECARCHDHKFDAISQADYYALAGFFYSTEQSPQRTGPRKELESKVNQKELAKLELDYQSYLDSKRQGRVKALSPKNKSGKYFPISDELGIQTSGDTNQLLQKMRAIDQLDPSWSMWVRSAKDVRGQDVPLLVRGEHHNASDAVPRRFLSALGTEIPAFSGSGREWLAEQIVDPQNPFTARVYANRIWHHLFGRGIVATPNDFGKLGEPPSHPELLDYLAYRLTQNEWSTKALIREIVLSKTYQQSSRVSQKDARRLKDLDPNNRFLSHQNRRRLTAEQIRDAMLSISGSLNLTMYGEGVPPYVPPFATANKSVHIPKSGPVDGANRRSIYIKMRRNFYDPFLRSLDFPDRGKPVGRRDVTVSPTQALTMLNSPLVNELSSDWGRRVAAEGDDGKKDRISEMWQTAIGRIPNDEERELLVAFDKQIGSNDRSWEHIAHLLFNHTEFLWID